jgi:hypothetical protein
VATPLPRRSRRLRSLSPEINRHLPIRRRLNRTDPHGLENIENTNTLIEETNNNQVEEPQISDGTSEGDNLEQQNLGSPIREGSPPISQVVPYPVDIEETPRPVQATLGTPIVGLQSPKFTNFRDFDHVNRTLRMFPLDQMATVNALENIPPIVTPVTIVVGTTVASL